MGRLIPFLIFLLLAVLLAVGLTISDRKTEIPSPLIGKSVPAFELPLLGDPDTRVNEQALLGEAYLLNVWASWCFPCRVEHPLITQLAESGMIRVIGLNYRDEPEDAINWLAGMGDPYQFVLSDIDGRVSIDFGVYAAPETFLVDSQGIIRFKHIGAITAEVVENELIPLIKQL